MRHQTAIFKSLAARNATFLLALIWIASPVPGLRPIYNNNQAAEATTKIKGIQQDSLSAEQRKNVDLSGALKNKTDELNTLNNRLANMMSKGTSCI